MFFYVYFQPELIDEAADAGEDAAQNLVAMLGGFQQNCFLAVFEDDRWGTAVKSKLERWTGDLSRRRVKQILTQLRKRNRFLDCLVPDYEDRASELDRVFQQAREVPLDLIVVVASETGRPVPDGVALATRSTYHSTDFEAKRLELAVDGRTCKPGAMTEDEFLNTHFLKAVRYAREIHICDRMCGRQNYADNFKYTTERLMAWLEGAIRAPESCTITFHLGQPQGRGAAYVRPELQGLMRGRLATSSLTVHFYDESLPDPSLPHQRFLLTDQVALDIDRGLDFLDRHTRRNRDTYVNYQNRDDAQALLDSYAGGRLALP